MFHGRDVRLYEALSRSTGVHIVASTGMGPEENARRLLPDAADQPADAVAGREVRRPLRPRRSPRAWWSPASSGGAPPASWPPPPTRAGMTPTDESLFRGAARAALATGVPVSIRYGADAVADLEIVLDEGLPADRVVVGGPRPQGRRRGRWRRSRWPAAAPTSRIDHVGLNDDDGLRHRPERAALVVELVEAGHARPDPALGQRDRRGQGPARLRPAVRARADRVRPAPRVARRQPTRTSGASWSTTRATC